MNAVAPKTSPVMPFNFLCDILPIIKITQKFKINPNKIAHKGKTKGKGRNQIIIATSPTIEGDATSFYIKDQLNEYKILISRIAYGVPMGGELEYVDNTTLGRAIQGRREIN